MKKLLFSIFIFFIFYPAHLFAQELPYNDITHFSKTFGSSRSFRLYLPENYSSSRNTFPVVYFFHGWGGRYYKDPSANIAYEKLGELVNKYQIILVMWDGNMEESEPRPYNVGNHVDMKYQVQVKDYFTELVNYIDTHYQTIPDRNHRGIIGFSMGGFMASFIAGKYPDKVSAAVSLTGSAEFFIGYPDNYTLYPVRYTLDNLRDVTFCLHNREECPMVGLNDEVNQASVWNNMENFYYKKIPGEHKIDETGETKVFESAISFITKEFKNPRKLKNSWSHYDLYPEFEVWGYSVQSNKSEPGFLYLRNVSKSGFGFYTYRWLPDGCAIKNCRAEITTPAIYNPGYKYEINISHTDEGKMEHLILESDKNGRLHFNLPGHGCEVGINEISVSPYFSVAGYRLNDNEKYLKINEENELIVRLLNRTKTIPENGKVKVDLLSTDPSVTLLNPVQEVSLKKGEQILTTGAFKIICTKQPPANGAPAWLNMKIKVSFDDSFNEDNFTIPVWFDVPYFKNIIVNTERNDTSINSQVIYPGERISIQEDGYLLKLYSEDPFVVTDEEKVFAEVLPAYWPDGLSLSSEVKIADDCPNGHVIEFLSYYETKTFRPIVRQRHWGKVKIVVKR